MLALEDVAEKRCDLRIKTRGSNYRFGILLVASWCFPFGSTVFIASRERLHPQCTIDQRRRPIE